MKHFCRELIPNGFSGSRLGNSTTVG
ncbi:hypothetical protein MED222_05440 [Vibrio sp. MED222]|nr:hypothetical protein MED222_05440 [Vibrio sp. MED222]